MAPKKRPIVEVSKRVTRSSTRKTQVISEEIPKKKKAKTAPFEEKIEEEAAPAVETKAVDGSKGKTIIIEHCKQCNSFKTRAFQVKQGLEKGLGNGFIVILNPEKPRRGCFEIREEGEDGEKFISLLDLKRPFSAMKALDMEQVISDIIEKIK